MTTLKEYLQDYQTKDIYLECINPKQYSLTKGDWYLVKGIQEQDGDIIRVYLINDTGNLFYYHPSLFKMLNEQKAELDEINKCKECDVELITNTNCRIFSEYCWTCEENILTTCIRCYKRTLKSETEDFTFLKDGNMGRYCKNCVQDLKYRGEQIIKCSSCNKYMLGYPKTTNICNKCKRPYGIVINKMFNRKFFEQEEYDEDGNEIRGTNLYLNNLNVLNSQTNNDKNIRTIGVELEVIPKKDYPLLKASTYLKKELHSKKYKGIRYDDLVILKEDGSLTSGGIEINSTIFDTSKNKIEVLKDIINIINKYFTTDRSCGLHIHLGSNDLTELETKRIIYLYQKLEPILKYFVSKNRIGNRYCKKLVKRNKEHLKNSSLYSIIGRDRYKAVNFTAMNKYGTIEIRLMDGNTSSDRIIEWILFHKRIIDYARQNTTLLDDLNRLSQKQLRKILGNNFYETYRQRKEYYEFQAKEKVIGGN
jgi:hypothetical protein